MQLAQEEGSKKSHDECAPSGEAEMEEQRLREKLMVNGDYAIDNVANNHGFKTNHSDRDPTQ